MNITEEIISIDSRWFSIERDVKRSPGMHLSNVIEFILNGGQLIDRDFDDAGIQAYMAGGFLWERVLHRVTEHNPVELWEYLFSRAMIEVENPRVVRPGEQFVDGIYMTPDGYDKIDKVLEEWKYTTKSSNNDIRGEKFSRWVNYQIPSYLRALGLRTCRLRVYFSRGDYKTGQPIWKEFMLEYTQQELDETWEMIVNNARLMEKKLLQIKTNKGV